MPPLPEVAGVEFRMFAGRPDYPHCARLITAHARGEGHDRVETVQKLASAYDHMVRCDPKRDLVVGEVDGNPVAFSRARWDPEPDGTRIYRQFCFVDPVFGGQGIGGALFAWNEERLREIAAEHEARAQWLEIYSNDRNPGLTALVRDHGYDKDTYFAEMVRPSVDDLPEHRLPEGIEVRPVTGDQLRAIWEADGEAGKDHWGFVERTEDDYQRFIEFPYLDTSLWKIAWDEEGVAGQVKSFIDTAQNEEYGRKRGWTEAISTARRWRRRGVAKALIVASIRELAGRGMSEVALGVHTDNPNGAYDLYAGLGYELVASWTSYRKPV